MMRKRMRAVVAVMLGVAMIGQVGCASGTPAPEPAATVRVGDSQATVGKGDTVVVNLGEWSSGVGDQWVLTEKPDPAVLTETELKPSSEGTSAPPGSRSEMTDAYEAVGAGEVTLTYEYRFRGEIPEDPGKQMTQTFTITVR
jgi:hypothetical protein